MLYHTIFKIVTYYFSLLSNEKKLTWEHQQWFHLPRLLETASCNTSKGETITASEGGE
jgi:hypothetical protein